MTIQARLQVPESAGERRLSSRRKLSLGSSLQGHSEQVTIHDFSTTGLLIETGAALARRDTLEIDLPELGIVPAVVVWNSGHYFGCQFNSRVPQAAISAALLRSPPTKTVARVPPKQRTVPVLVRESVPQSSAEVLSAGQEEKASLTVRLRVILGSAIVLWALIYWAAVSVLRLLRSHL